MGYSVVEAMFHGVPSIVSDVGGMKELIRASTGGQVVAAGDVNAMAAAMTNFVTNKSLQVRMGSAARDYASRELTADKMAELTVRVYYSDALGCRNSCLLQQVPIVCSAASPISMYRCPVCSGSDLRLDTEALWCVACGIKYPVTCGVPDFTQSPDFYWGELDRSVIRELLVSSNKFDDSLEHLLNTRFPQLKAYLWHYATNRCRAGWKYLAPFPAGGRVLDFGCGWGELGLSLAETGSEVVFTDGVPERVAVAIRRARDRNLTNVTGCATMGTTRLPFPDASFDMVVLNGVLEWVPISGKGNPRANQRDLLREICRVLRPQGCVYIGIENRFGASYFIGRREEHTKLRFVSLLPRFLGRIYHRMWTRKPYRTYTHSARGLPRLLSEAGFTQTTLYSPYPDYRDFVSVVNLQSRDWIRHSFHPHSLKGKVQFYISRKTGVLKWCANSFGAMACKSHPLPSFMERLIEEFAAKYPSCGRLHIISYTLNANAMIHVLLTNGTKEYILTMSLDQHAGQRILMGTRRRRTLSENLQAKGETSFGSDFVAGEMEGVPYVLENYSSALRASELIEAQPALKQIMKKNSLLWLQRFHSVNLVRGRCQPDEILGGDWDCLLDVFPQDIREVYRDVLGRIFKYPLVLSIVHGDYRYPNILVDRKGNIDKVIDFEFCQMQGLPLWDVLGLLLDDTFETGVSWADSYQMLQHKILDSDFISTMAKQYVEGLGLTQVDVLAALVTVPLLHLQHKSEVGARDVSIIYEHLSTGLMLLFKRIEKELDAIQPAG